MNTKRLIHLFLLFILLFSYTTAFIKTKFYRTVQFQQGVVRAPVIPARLAGAFAGEFQGVSSDFLYLEAASALGGIQKQPFTTKQWDGIEKILRVAIALDPNFEPLFRTVQAFLPWGGERPAVAIELLEKVYQERNWHWLVPYFIGFDHYFFLTDPHSASQSFMEASQLPSGPPILATFSARLAAESGSIEAGIEFLLRILESKEEPNERKMISDRINALKGVSIIQTALTAYQGDHQKYPQDLDELVTWKYLRYLPFNPYHDSFYYRGGKVQFDPFKGLTGE